jgi:hypothetical protein
VSREVSNQLDWVYISSSDLLKMAAGVKSSRELEKFDQTELNNIFVKALLAVLESSKNQLCRHSFSYFLGDGRRTSRKPKLYEYARAILDIQADPQTISERIYADNQSGKRIRLLSTDLDEINNDNLYRLKQHQPY